MLCKLSLSIVAVVLLMLPGQLLAGGAARVCVPINNVSSMGAADQCSKLLTDFLGERASQVTMQEHKGQWYATISLRQDLNLKDVSNAFSGSSFSVPHEKLTLFGPARLSITVRTKFIKGFISDLETVQGLTVDDSSRDGSELLVTINQSDSARNLDDATKRAHESPSYDAVKKLLASNNADLSDVRWSSEWHCRGVFGCLVTPTASKKETVAKK